MTQVTNRQTLLEKVGRKWKSDPIFSTGLVLALMVILQTVALGFDYESFGAWFTNWGKNWINILRNNAGVGIVALGMTFVIISGGIDLAVGSTMVAIGAVIMVFINQYPDGLLTAIGITGVPAYAIGIVAGVIFGCLLGGISGVLIARSKLPAFIATLGMMKILRSVTQQVMQTAGGQGAQQLFGHLQHQDRRRGHSAHSLLAGGGGDSAYRVALHALWPPRIRRGLQ